MSFLGWAQPGTMYDFCYCQFFHQSPLLRFDERLPVHSPGGFFTYPFEELDASAA